MPPRSALAPARRPAGAALLALLPALATCDRSNGQVELNWTVVDAAGSAVFPFGGLRDLCRFTGRTEAGGDRRPYGLHVELRLCEPDCPAGCGDPSCQVDRLRYACDAARGFDTVPAAEEYEFSLALVAEPADGACGCELTAACALVPGPRRRAVEPGLVTDLQVYLLVLGGLDLGAAESEAGRIVMDLDACCAPDLSCS